MTLVLAIVLCLCSAPAAAEDEGGLPLRRLGFDRSADLLTISVRFPDIFDAAALAKLQSGFPSTIVLRAYLFRDQEQVPMGVVLRTTRIVFDLWDEVYLVRIVDERGEATFKATSQNAAVASATTLDRFPLIPRSRLASGQRFALVVLVELNPVSPELLAQVRKWLARPPGGQRMLGPGDSLLGSFVSFFVNQRLSEAERALRFRSQPFTAR